MSGNCVDKHLSFSPKMQVAEWYKVRAPSRIPEINRKVSKIMREVKDVIKYYWLFLAEHSLNLVKVVSRRSRVRFSQPMYAHKPNSDENKSLLDYLGRRGYQGCSSVTCADKMCNSNPSYILKIGGVTM